MYFVDHPLAQPRFGNFDVPRIVDDTLREGVERCMIAVRPEQLMRLVTSMVAAGLREFVVGWGPELPDIYGQVCEARDAGEVPPDVMPTILVPLERWGATRDAFQRVRPGWIGQTAFSFGPVLHRREERSFEKAVRAFVGLGAPHVEAAVPTDLAGGVGDRAYDDICGQIDWAHDLGIRTIRVDDAAGKLFPETTEVLCRRLVEDYPDIAFRLHCDSDHGLALANQLMSIYSGFQMMQGNLCGYGSRSGISVTENLIAVCASRNIRVGAAPLDAATLCRPARIAEEIFFRRGRRARAEPCGSISGVPD